MRRKYFIGLKFLNTFKHFFFFLHIYLKSCGWMWKEVELEHPASCTGFDLLKQNNQERQVQDRPCVEQNCGFSTNGERSSKHCCAQCLACRGEQLPVGQHALPVATHASDTQPAVYFLYNRKWTGFWREGRGRVAHPAGPEPNTISVCLETGFGAILTPCWQKILAFRVSAACLYSKTCNIMFCRRDHS